MSPSHWRQLVVFHWSLSDSNFPQISIFLLSIQANLNNAVVWMASIHPPIFNSSCLPSKPLGTVPSATIIIGITTRFMLRNFLSSLAKSYYLFLFSLSMIFTLWSSEKMKSIIRQVLFFYLSFCVSLSWTDSGLCIQLFASRIKF